MSQTPKTPTPDQGLILVEDIPQNRPLAIDLALSAEVLDQLAQDIGASGLGKFRFAGQIERPADGQVLLTATLGATVTQPCVVTLAPVRTRVDENITRRYANEDAPTAAEYQLREDEDVDVDALGPQIDLLAVIREALILALPAYPRAQDAELPEAVVGPPGVEALSDEAMRPFAALAALKSKMEEKE